ncbi:MAG: hypothetical protein J6W31_01115 [Clostridia bacterium]|nr:hypothetical protein [Clostridia bacterium]
MTEQIWKIDGDRLIWQVGKGQVHTDDIEMSGFYADEIISYGVKEDGSLHLAQSFYFPTLRTIPNDTHATYHFDLNKEQTPCLLKDGVPVKEFPIQFELDGTLCITSETDGGVLTVRRFYPAKDSLLCVEKVSLIALEDTVLTLSLPAHHVHTYGRGTKGVYLAEISHDAPEKMVLSSGDDLTYYVYYTARIANQPLPERDGMKELLARLERVYELCDTRLVLQTDNPTADAMFRFAKLRAGESIFQTLTGKYHSPGGRSYYAATWCNDQAEYAGPHFAIAGDKVAIEASLNAYRSYIPFMSDCYHKLPCSIIAEGLDIWEGAGDRGDAAMYLYGASLFCLYTGDRTIAEELYPAIRWCAEYCRRQTLPEGVIRSDSDELEGRFPTDRKANLSTSSLCYGGLMFAAKLAESLGDTETAKDYRNCATALGEAIENYFGANLHGFDTYRYSKGYDTLRAWICLPLCMELNGRKEGTLEAMLSPYLWTEEGMLTCEISDENRSHTIWDRSTLYGMKAAFLAGAGDRIIEPFLAYCSKRLLCDRVPYAVEAYPEGEKRHLSGESALFARVVTEGIFGIRPEGLHKFSFLPQVFEGLGEMKLENIPICGGCFDIRVGKDVWVVCDGGKEIARGETNGERVMIG